MPNGAKGTSICTIQTATNCHLRNQSAKTARFVHYLDEFLKRLTDFEEEVDFLKKELKRVKAVIRETLGVSIDWYGLSTGPHFWRTPSRSALLGSSLGAVRVLVTRAKKWRGWLGVQHKQI